MNSGDCLIDAPLLMSREYAGTKKMRFKPVIISHHMLMGLKEVRLMHVCSHMSLTCYSWMQVQEKMSKSDPDSAIFMEDAAEDVRPYALIREPALISCCSLLR